MVTRYSFGYGEGEIRRRRQDGQEAMRRQVESEQSRLPEEARQRLGYDSDYYGFRGAGSRAQPKTGGSTESREGARRPAQRDFRRSEPRRWRDG